MLCAQHLDYLTLTVSAGSTFEINRHGMSNDTIITTKEIISAVKTRPQLIFTGTNETK